VGLTNTVNCSDWLAITSRKKLVAEGTDLGFRSPMERDKAAML
jgi:hypothetical protein